MAIGRRMRDELGADDAACSGAVLRNHLPAELPAQVRGDHAPDQIVQAAGRERNDDPHLLGGVLLRRRRCREGQDKARDREQPWV